MDKDIIKIANYLRGVKRRIKILCRQDIEYAFRMSRGVLHIGASTGQERFVYDEYGLEVLWIEPLPDVFQTLSDNINNLKGQRALMVLISDTDGVETEYFVADNNGMSSSILRPKRHREAWDRVEFSETVYLTTIRLDTLVEREGIDMSLYDCLVLDTQGAELMVLQGAGDLLANFRFIITEAADFEAYEGCCTINELKKYLKERGFTERLRTTISLKNNWHYYDVLFEKNKYV